MTKREKGCDDIWDGVRTGDEATRIYNKHMEWMDGSIHGGMDSIEAHVPTPLPRGLRREIHVRWAMH